MNLHTTIFILLIFIGSSLNAMEIGFSANYGMHYNDGEITYELSNDGSFVAEDGHFSEGYSVGAVFGYSMNELLALDIRASFIQSNHHFKQTGDKIPTQVAVYDEETGELIGYEIRETTIYNNAEGNTSFISLDPSLKINIYNNFSFISGLSLNYSASSSMKLYNELDKGRFIADGYELSADSTQQILYNDEVPEMSNFLIGITLGFDYEIEMENFSICPEVIFRHYLNDYTKSDSWKMSRINFGVAVRFGI